MSKITRKIKLILISIVVLLSMLVIVEGCSTSKKEVDITILMTSDTHGKFYNWNYTADTEDNSGSLLQIATAIKEIRNEKTLLFDGGDIIQDNGGVVTINKNDNWKIIGNDWDESLHDKAVSELNDQTISLYEDEKGNSNYRSIRIEDLK